MEEHAEDAELRKMLAGLSEDDFVRALKGKMLPEVNPELLADPAHDDDDEDEGDEDDEDDEDGEEGEEEGEQVWGEEDEDEGEGDEM